MKRSAASALLAAGLLLGGCAAPRGTGAGAARAPRAPDQPLRFVLFYVIHGDADYVYHDAVGSRRLADADAVAQAQEVARNALAAEVFIFHQRPRWHLWRNPAPDGMAWHYRRGELMHERAYSREGTDHDFAAEESLYKRWADKASLPRQACAAADAPAAMDTSAPSGAAMDQAVIPEPVRLFAYFGHEIPVVGGRGYSRSHPRQEFSLPRFTRGLERFAGPPCSRSKAYSLVVLSSCRGGTPAVSKALFPYSDWLLASPTELHLSFLDTRAFIPLLATAGSAEAWAPGPRRIRVEASAERMLRESFGRLGERTQAPISLALYDAEKATAYLEERPAAWSAASEPAPGIRMAPLAWRDCADDPDFGHGGEAAGTRVLYRPGRFGLLKAKNAHSGWECPQPVATEWIGERQPDASPRSPDLGPAAPAEGRAPDPSG